jgi:outer membrane protein insertion porin family
MRRASGLVLWLVFLLPAAVAAQDGDALMGRTVERLVLDLDGVRTSDPALLDLIETRPGAPLQARAVRESVAHLFGLGRFDDVRVHATAVDGGGLLVRYELIGARNLSEVRFTGTLGIGESELRRAIAERFGLSASVTRAGDVTRFLEGFYQDRGHLQARVTVPETASAGGGPLVLHVEAGPRATVSAVRVEGNAPGTLARARSELGLSPGQPYDARRVAARLAEYVASLRQQGYYEAQAEHDVLVAADQRSVELVVTIDAGAHVTVIFEGDPVPPRVRRDLVPIDREGSVDEDLLEDVARNIADHFRAQGYRDASVTFRRTDRNGELAIVFRVDRGPAYRVGTVEISGNATVPLADLAPAIGLRRGAPFLDAQLDADVNALRLLYRRRGHGAARIQSAVIPEPGPAPVETTVRITITEGPRTTVGRILIAGNTAVDERVLRGVIGSETGGPLFEPQIALDRDAVALQFLNRGYAQAEVSVEAAFDAERTRADLTFTVRQGPQVFVDHVLVVGNVRTSAETIRRELTLSPGEPLSFEGITESQRRVSALGLFRRVRITEIDHGAESRRDLLVTVEEAPATTIGYGGGVEAGQRLLRTITGGVPDERLEIAPRGFFEIGRRNLFGGNRSVSLFTRASLRLRSDPALTRDGQQPAADFNEYRVLGTYRQPRVIANTDFVASGVLEQGARTSFDFNRRGVRAELARRIRPTVSVAGRYALERTEVFNETVGSEEQNLIDRVFPQVRLSTVSSSFIRDTRDDVLGPTSGALIGFDAELAGRAIGSEVGFAKSFAQGFFFRRLPGRRGVVLATGVRVGMARGFGREVRRVGDDGQVVVDVVSDLPASERFFTGGDTTVRGFSLDQLGTPDTLDDRTGFPLGGNGVIVLNAELRVPVWRDLGIAAFMDGGNVFRRAADISLDDIRGAAGLGLRYRSPIGPLRLDLGFKLDRRVLPNGQLERPRALHISLGQAF